MRATPPIVVAITGASGAPYAVRLLQALTAAHRPISLIVSKYGMRLLATESGIGSMDALRDAVGIDAWASYVEVFSNDDRGAAPASGSSRTAGMIVCPCSMATLSAIAAGASRSLIERAADVTLKEQRKLVLVPRETPLSAIHLGNMIAPERMSGRCPAWMARVPNPALVSSSKMRVIPRFAEVDEGEVNQSHRTGPMRSSPLTGD